ncbi:GDP-mannose 4,6-dehydratase [Polynucleobacter sp. MWH-UH35A]|uniref:GDP-mannose 4,6-dehydratase n=1 Tax=Polynucleobacter sp. MWH-UH35A TaxID=1855619 RepID=UPI001BFE98F1|nr:GDP-mannose 4,6-dehydratase [Polynucleobacter sp. MWH-UH35A]QWD60442.1 GDP-mannose 4,6-dehydratase [Polynucleobacter sp. MWH-UH35A]
MGKILITGGAGFIGSNAACYFSEKGWQVVVLDNLSRKGANINCEFIQGLPNVIFKKGDIRDVNLVNQLIKQEGFNAILHLAGQVAVTTSLVDPEEDFEINARGTFNILEAIRKHSPNTVLIYSSTNKVYGKMENTSVIERNGRYEYENLQNGISEEYPLSFYSPYGCSKGAGDQYVIDYARIYGLRTISFRQSCIYGPRQFGVEDQGWIAWFTIASMLGKSITVYGDGKQIRDVLHVSDLVRAYDLAIQYSDKASGHAFNIGGGKSNTLSLNELVKKIEKESGEKIEYIQSDWRPGDQKVFVCDTSKINKFLGWNAVVGVNDGLGELYSWTTEHLDEIRKALR